MRDRHFWMAGFIAIALVQASSVNAAQSVIEQAPPRVVVRTADDLPRFSYPIEGHVATLAADDAVVLPLLRRVRADVEMTLQRYDISERAVLRQLHYTLRNIALVQGDLSAAKEEVAILRGLQDKEADQLVSGLYWLAYFDGLEAGAMGTTAFRDRFRTRYAALLADLPWAVVGDGIRDDAIGNELSSLALMTADFEKRVQPAIDAGGSIGNDGARFLASFMLAQRLTLPLKEDALAVEFAYVAANDIPKPDIWAERTAVLPPEADLTPVVIAVWDSGVDAALFRDNLWRNPGEILNGLDDDGNGYVDDLNGIAFNEFTVPETGPLLTAPSGIASRLEQTRALDQGYSDQLAGKRSPAAIALGRHIDELSAEQAAEMSVDLDFYHEYAHGTHVAGIVVAGNPGARLLIVRASSEWRNPPSLPTDALAERYAQLHREVVAYMKANGVRVVNISWGTSAKVYENALEANGVPSGEREVQARRMFEIESRGLREAIASAPEILFVVGAGNDNDNAEFSGFIPSSIEADNVLTVAAVDQAGDPTDFTSSGPAVDLAANGYEVESFVPGGARIAWSGTSMSSPQVANLASKLLAIRPELSVAELRALLLNTSTTTAAGYRLVHPAAALTALSHSDSARLVSN